LPELPEIATLANQMATTLKDKRIQHVEISQPKCLNIPTPEFQRRVNGKTVGTTEAHGKWLFTQVSPGENLLLNLGMGGDLLYHKSSRTIPEKRQAFFTFSDDSALTVSFWWFGYVHLANDAELPDHKMTQKLGVSPSEASFTYEILSAMLSRKRGAIKSFLLDQKNIAGIGNVYVQDILFKAGLHPQREIPSIGEPEIHALFRGIKQVLNRSTKLGGLKYERDLYGRNGRFGPAQFLVGYRTGEPCPVCHSKIRKIKTGTTSSYICPKCQRK